MRIFVTGAGGFIGSHLCEALRDAGHDVTGMAHYCGRDTYGWLDEVDGVNKVRGDIRDQDLMRELVSEHTPDAFYNLAALGSVPYSYQAPQSFIDTNVTGTLNSLLAMQGFVGKFIHMSTSEVYGTAQYEPQDEKHPINPQSPYAASKVAADALVTSFAATYDMDCTIVRCFNTFGPRQSERAIVATIIRQYLDPKCEELTLGNVWAERDLTYVGDTCTALINVLGTNGLGPFNVGRGTKLTVGMLAFTVGRILGYKKFINHDDKERLRPVGNEVQTLRCAPSVLMPEVHTLEYGLERTIEWWRSRPLPKLCVFV